MSWYLEICSFLPKKTPKPKKGFLKKGMCRVFSFCFPLRIVVLLMSTSIMLSSVMEEDKCSKVLSV